MKHYREDQIYLIAGIGKCDGLYENRDKFIGLRGYFSETTHLGGRWSTGVFSPAGNGKDLAFDKVRFELDDGFKGIVKKKKADEIGEFQYEIEETQNKGKEDKKSWPKHGKN